MRKWGTGGKERNGEKKEKMKFGDAIDIHSFQCNLHYTEHPIRKDALTLKVGK